MLTKKMTFWSPCRPSLVTQTLWVKVSDGVDFYWHFLSSGSLQVSPGDIARTSVLRGGRGGIKCKNYILLHKKYIYYIK